LLACLRAGVHYEPIKINDMDYYLRVTHVVASG
jgi:hypothetical protein